MNKDKEKNQIAKKIFYIYLFSLCFGIFTIDVGFSIKPYMFATILIYIYLMLTKQKFTFNFGKIDLIYILFMIFCSLELLFVEHSDNSFRYILGMIIMYISYFGVANLCKKISKRTVENTICNVGLVFSIITIIYYLVGLKSLNFNFIGNGVISYGVLLDRSVARLISFASSDPNITAFIFTLFFFFNLKNIKSIKNKISVFLISSIIILTFSRGAILAFSLSFLYFILYEKNISSTIKRAIKIVVPLIIVLFILNIISDGLVFDIFIKRFSESLNDGGSGRMNLWDESFKIFNNHPILGIGLNNSRYYISGTYIHNTFLQVLAETGIVGFAFYIIYILLIYLESKKIDVFNKNNFFRSITICFLFQMFLLSILLQESFFTYLALLKVTYDYTYKKENTENEN